MFVTGSYILEWIVIAVTIVPNLAAGSRRLHDIDRSGWWQLIAADSLIRPAGHR